MGQFGSIIHHIYICCGIVAGVTNPLFLYFINIRQDFTIRRVVATHESTAFAAVMASAEYSKRLEA